MIIGSMDTLDENHVDYPEIIQKALDYLRDTDFTKVADGRYPIAGDKCFANVQRYNTRPEADCKPETHVKYVDIQYMVDGEEFMGWCPYSPDLEPLAPYDAEKDVTFYKALVPDSSIVLSPGCFAVLYPEDVHRPQAAVNDIPSPVIKVVVKVAVDSL
ncbi:MAG: YhcH/YjgK/YiaL family protein [Selenomonas sp.]|jgi:YhcH/YjgK/YiaL family protein|uniref:YhcH/YjgK/YiaL family protein n=1 Tax=Selenomonas sp. AE3005 TaxID=1485543 RepID=UPI000488A6DE|nr:YhcH/YjgK/YiaL family protein [Selenomonas sp. AE3005]MBQ1416531.1 YhcH/YjgK/YiaL family protein [Selenomonas sp.]MBQ1462086.1 YhcH/YjgK/YiaL family protein [Selenomonas sp.]MBQ1614901.1 YhcH/YjgK/YiaL family protein [Selenomonas sp.]MBQ1809346.1 YhcH/YjgK/YiaL family protein [Selenomonas sp.]MBQ1919862.1 YhcH/YjgK/YiaL family protein [Selenomonas sp.]